MHIFYHFDTAGIAATRLFESFEGEMEDARFAGLETAKIGEAAAVGFAAGVGEDLLECGGFDSQEPVAAPHGGSHNVDEF